MLEGCWLHTQPPAQLPALLALSAPPAHRKSEKEVESLGGGGLFLTSWSRSREHRAGPADTGRAGPGWPQGSAPPVPTMRALPEVLSCVVLQVVYDEGPLYIFSPTEELRKRWIHQLKSGECRALQLPQLCLCFPTVPGTQGLTGSWLPVPCVSKSELLLPGPGGHCHSLQHCSYLSSLPSHKPAPK